MRNAGEAPQLKDSRVGIACAVLACVCALALGVFARFKALAAAPLAVDEYFIVRSTQNLLRHGWPVFECGGWYTRGLLLQYLAALLDLLGASPETAPRLISAASSVLALPAAYIVGRRVGGPTVGLLAVTVLALSVWESELARFGRMYAPFQAVFVWYVVCYLRRTVDRDERAEWPMIILTLLGALLWEGGVLMALANFVPVFLERRSLKLSKSEWAGLVKFVVVLAASYWFVTTDFRMLDSTPALPSDYDAAASDTLVDASTSDPYLLGALAAHRVWLILFLLPLAACAMAVRSVLRRREADLTAAALLVALAAALMHQFLAATSLLLLMALFRFSSRSQLTSAAARASYAALGCCALFWLTFACATLTGPTGSGLLKTLLYLARPLLGFPDFLGQVVEPWGRAVPLLGAGLLVLVGVSLARGIGRDESGVSAERAVLALLVCLLLAACASPTPRHETRYIFFLYPLAVIVALATISSVVRQLTGRSPAAAIVAPVLCLIAFMLSEDYQPRHLLEINRPASIFKASLSPAQQSHLVVREDTRALALWLRQHAGSPGDAVITAYQSLDYYDPKVDFFYVDRSDFNFEAYACHYGTVERWSNRPLLQSVPAVESIISSKPRTHLVTYSARLGALLPQLANFHPRIEWALGGLSVIAFDSPAVPAAAPH